MRKMDIWSAVLLCGVPALASAQTGLPAAPDTAKLSLVAPVDPDGGPQAQTAMPQQATATAAVTGVGPAPTLTRAQAEAIALKNNPRITVSHLLMLAQQQVVRESRSGELPQVDGSVTALNGYSGSRQASEQLSDSRLIRHAGGQVIVSQLITDFGRTHNLVASSKLQAQAEESNEQATREDVVLVTDVAFYEALRAQAILNLAQQTVSTRKATQLQIGQLTRNNLRSTLDELFSDVNVSQAQLLVLDAQDNANATTARLDEVLGLDRLQNYTLVEEGDAPPPPPPDIDVLVQMAVKQRPDLKALFETRDAEMKFSKAQGDQRLPTVTGIGTVGGTPVRDGRYFDSSWDGAVAGNINLPIFNGFLFSAQAKEAALRSQATDAQSVALRDKIVRDVRTSWLTANNDFTRIGVTAQLLNQANQSLKLAETRYNLGLSSIVELSQAQLNQTQADISHTNAGYTYRSALSALQFQIGQQP